MRGAIWGRLPHLRWERVNFHTDCSLGGAQFAGSRRKRALITPRSRLMEEASLPASPAAGEESQLRATVSQSKNLTVIL